jgi:hypothetical protein
MGYPAAIPTTLSFGFSVNLLISPSAGISVGGL